MDTNISYNALLLEAEAGYLQKDFVLARNRLLRILQSRPRDSKANELLGLICIDENRVSEAIEHFRISVKDESCSPLSLYKLASIYSQTENYHLSIEYLKKLFDRNQNSLEIALEIASLYAIIEKYDELLQWLKTANSISPNNKEILYNIGRAYDQIFDTSNAIIFYEDAHKIDKNFIEPVFNIGTIYAGQRKFQQALEYFIKAYEIDPSYEYLLGNIISALKNLCMWPLEERYMRIFDQAFKVNGNLVTPFQYLSMNDSPAHQLEVARNFSVNKYGDVIGDDLKISDHNFDRIKVAYISSDFRTHAMAFLTAQLFECHDRDRFELYAVSLFPFDHDDPWTLRLKNAFENFIDASSKSDDEIVRVLRELGIDIAIDLMGHTAFSRSMIFAKRVAPIQVNFLGYPGTMGAKFIDYIVADKLLVPAEYRGYYSENIIYMPHTFQPNDSKKIISKNISSRSQLGLPEARFVFCCFNSIYKINKDIFSAWIEILKLAPNSVLWLCSADEEINANLYGEMSEAGIAPDRLIFSKPAPYEDYLETYLFADLFLDTMPFNAGTTARDALWSGVPVLTVQGKSFSGRMASSLLRAINMDELIARDINEYKSLAVRLATSDEFYNSIKSVLSVKRESPSLEIEAYTESLEMAYEKIFKLARYGGTKEDIFLP